MSNEQPPVKVIQINLLTVGLIIADVLITLALLTLLALNGANYWALLVIPFGIWKHWLGVGKGLRIGKEVFILAMNDVYAEAKKFKDDLEKNTQEVV